MERSRRCLVEEINMPRLGLARARRDELTALQPFLVRPCSVDDMSILARYLK
jgi:hypothetical protein